MTKRVHLTDGLSTLVDTDAPIDRSEDGLYWRNAREADERFCELMTRAIEMGLEFATVAYRGGTRK